MGAEKGKRESKALKLRSGILSQSVYIQVSRLVETHQRKDIEDTVGPRPENESERRGSTQKSAVPEMVMRWSTGHVMERVLD